MRIVVLATFTMRIVVFATLGRWGSQANTWIVPKNNFLAAVDPASGEAPGFGSTMSAVGTARNQVRTAASIAAAASLTFGVSA